MKGMYESKCFLTSDGYYRPSHKTTAVCALTPMEKQVLLFCKVQVIELSNYFLYICYYVQGYDCCHSQLSLKRKFSFQMGRILQMLTTSLILRISHYIYSIVEQCSDTHGNEIRCLFYILEVQENCRRVCYFIHNKVAINYGMNEA